jgi:GNAT superfamily N-acetyltransferase
MPAQELQYEVLTLPELNDALTGSPLPDGTVVPPWLLSPNLKYYETPWGGGKEKENRYLFLMATVALKEDEIEECWSSNRRNVRKAVGVLELQWSPFELEENVVWLKYVTVDPHWQGRGIARQLARNMVIVLSKLDCRLDRSRPSEEGFSRIKSYIDQILNEAGIRWTQPAPLMV